MDEKIVEIVEVVNIILVGYIRNSLVSIFLKEDRILVAMVMEVKKAGDDINVRKILVFVEEETYFGDKIKDRFFLRENIEDRHMNQIYPEDVLVLIPKASFLVMLIIKERGEDGSFISIMGILFT